MNRPVISIPVDGEGKPRNFPSVKRAASFYHVSVARVSSAIRRGDLVLKCRRFFDYSEAA